MAETSELIEFRRAFVWLLCGMLLPSVALVAFGVVAVANERAAVERRLAEDYDARLRALGLDLLARLDKSAEAVAKHGAGNPMGRPGQPEEVSPAFVFFASEADSSYITGEVLTVNGADPSAA